MQLKHSSRFTLPETRITVSILQDITNMHKVNLQHTSSLPIPLKIQIRKYHILKLSSTEACTLSSGSSLDYLCGFSMFLKWVQVMLYYYKITTHTISAVRLITETEFKNPSVSR